MNCDAVTKSLPLYYYGELPAETEEGVEEHVASCDTCRAGLERQRLLAVALDRHAVEAPAGLLAECRHELSRAIYREEARPAHTASDPWSLFRDAFRSLWHPGIRFVQPAGAVALLAIGFFSARFVPGSLPGIGRADLTPDSIVSSIRSVQPDHTGRVQISLDETRRRIVSGRLDDENIRKLLMAAAREQDNPGVRVESVGLLKDQCTSADTRGVLLEAVLHDPNPGVRLKALEGLKSFATDPDVRHTLSQVLLKDQNAGVRIQVIDLLITRQDPATIGVLQTLIGKEDNGYVRMRCQNALRDMNASIGTF